MRSSRSPVKLQVLTTRTVFSEAGLGQEISPYHNGAFVEICEGIYLGSENLSSLKQSNIKTVISVAKELMPNLNYGSPNNLSPTASSMPIPIKNLTTYLSSSCSVSPLLNSTSSSSSISSSTTTLRSDEDLSSLFFMKEGLSYYFFPWTHSSMPFMEESLDIVDASLKEGDVLIHCQQGVSRSVTLVLAHLMRSKGLPFQQAYELVKSKAPWISPNVALISQLCFLQDSNWICK